MLGGQVPALVRAQAVGGLAEETVVEGGGWGLKEELKRGCGRTGDNTAQRSARRTGTLSAVWFNSYMPVTSSASTRTSVGAVTNMQTLRQEEDRGGGGGGEFGSNMLVSSSSSTPPAFQLLSPTSPPGASQLRKDHRPPDERTLQLGKSKGRKTFCFPFSSLLS
jgi:hypothetical protein